MTGQDFLLWDTIVLVTEQVRRFGLRPPFADLGADQTRLVVDYKFGMTGKEHETRYLTLKERPFSHIDPRYTAVLPQKNHTEIDELPGRYPGHFGTITCLHVLGKTPNPFDALRALFEAMKDGGMLIVSEMFSYPFDRRGTDYWRFSPECLKMIGIKAGFAVVECNWRLAISAEMGMLNAQTGEPLEIRSVYAVFAKGDFSPTPGCQYQLPQLESTSNSSQRRAEEVCGMRKHTSCQTPQGSEAEPVLEPVASASGIRKKPKCMFVNVYYQAFLESHYQLRRELLGAPYSIQVTSILQSFFGDSDYYSRGFQSIGWDTQELIANCEILQNAWARENGCQAQGIGIAVEQIKRFSPEILYIQDINAFGADFIEAVRPHVRLIAGQIACPLNPSAPLKGYDVLFSSFPHYVRRFREQGLTAYYRPLAFEPRVLKEVPPMDYFERPIPCAFIGGISQAHAGASKLFEHLVEKTPIEFWGYGAEALPSTSPLRARHHGPVWGLEMFGKLACTKIAVNRHIDVAENYANNMRLFEATGCGALLITDYKDNLGDLFKIGEEVVAYRSAEECAMLVQYYSENPSEAQAIARAGQARTLSDHTYEKTLAKTAEVLERHLRYQAESNFYEPPRMDEISCGYSPIAPEQVDHALTCAWQDKDLPLRQRALVQKELLTMYKGGAVLVYEVLAAALKPLVRNGSSVLEIGCSSGYYYEVLEYLLNRGLSYCGVDYSEAMIEMARNYYPRARFVAADGAGMPFADGEFETAISSCVLLHVPNYGAHINETARVARDFVVAHRTPVCRKGRTRHFKKRAYGVETVELVFNESELIGLFVQAGLALSGGIEFEAAAVEDRYCVTYVFKKDRGQK